MNKAKINKYIEYITTKIKIIYKQKKFKSSGYALKYILEKNDSDILIVVLSGVPRRGLKARYNYGRTLSSVKVNKLFILDDFGYDNRGAWYLGKDKDFKIKEATENLILKVKKDLKSKRTIYCGSSKGGYNAIMFGLEDKDSTIIAGGPQYYLGERLTNGIYPTYTLPYIMGKDYNDEDIAFLDNFLPKIVKKSKINKCKIYLHFSNKEYMYDTHIKYLIKDLDNFGINYTADVANYEKHAEIAYHFPPFLIKTLNDILE